jgi:hypothetical protein
MKGRVGEPPYIEADANRRGGKRAFFRKIFILQVPPGQ